MQLKKVIAGRQFWPVLAVMFILLGILAILLFLLT